jgi:hypothetical protein
MNNGNLSTLAIREKELCHVVFIDIILSFAWLLDMQEIQQLSSG